VMMGDGWWVSMYILKPEVEWGSISERMKKVVQKIHTWERTAAWPDRGSDTKSFPSCSIPKEDASIWNTSVRPSSIAVECQALWSPNISYWVQFCMHELVGRISWPSIHVCQGPQITHIPPWPVILHARV
jgi:hypothetical protein